ncbi:glycosyl hydrolase family 16 [Algoriphagus ratkowskyi]|uniref:Glycoside hydrolase family 16 protein n=1 Tax=Algoriphagus ratkowskyi TaxID=57028 RepID=A0A2W7QV18_9BACT|nr:glycoside hydrolase family 16 protein [Algoriphagus ratkowskyi]PZX52114.1 glycosyl hydrolase family 16 [Algoriphagus ratkowskyi]TXD76122.1 glycoside hydrolase family 16 protein [Algoriphagus ratkowskyi]
MRQLSIQKILPILSILAIPLFAADCDKKESAPSTINKDQEIKWKLVFEDEFEGTETDPQLWASYQPQTHSSAWNKYVNPADKSLAEVKDGNLYLRAKWNTATDLPETGAIQTKDKFSFTYGKLEVKAKFNRTGQGAWPAIWLMPQTPVFQNWPDGGEIDVMEHLNKDNFVYQVMHQSKTEGVEMKPAPFVTPDINQDKYNTYGIIKTANKIEFYVNDKKTMTYTKGGENADRWPFETDFYLILNHASADKGQSGTYYWSGLVVSTDDFPYEMAIDYVKLWEEVE